MKETLSKSRLLVFALALTLATAPWCGTGAAVAAAEPQAKPRQQSAPRRAAPQTAKPAATAPASAPLAEPVPVVNKVLANGLEIIVLEDHSVPLVTVELAVRNGSFTEPPELNGLSHLYEHMFFKPGRAAVIGEDYIKNI